MEIESIKYSWKWLNASELLSHGPCEFIYARGYGTVINWTVDIYDGENITGDRIIRFGLSSGRNLDFSPKVPVYCRRGLYVDFVANIQFVFVQWRELGHRESGG